MDSPVLTALCDGKSGYHSVQAWDRAPVADDPAVTGTLLHPGYTLPQEDATNSSHTHRAFEKYYGQRLSD